MPLSGVCGGYWRRRFLAALTAGEGMGRKDNAGFIIIRCNGDGKVVYKKFRPIPGGDRSVVRGGCGQAAHKDLLAQNCHNF